MFAHNCTVEVEEALGTAAVEALTTPFPLHNIDGTSKYVAVQVGPTGLDRHLC
jgi:hypothetical protein